jgi:hypothetical protein
MLKFITDRLTPCEPEILEPVKDKTLLIVSLEGQCLGIYDPPNGGWTHNLLCKLSESFPEQWSYCGADALIGDQFVGSTEI